MTNIIILICSMAFAGSSAHNFFGQDCDQANSKECATTVASEISVSEQQNAEIAGIERLAAAVEAAQAVPELTKELLMSKQWKFGSGDTISFTDSSVYIHDVSGRLVALFYEYEIDGNMVKASKGAKQERHKFSWDEEDIIPGSMTFAWDGERFQ